MLKETENMKKILTGLLSVSMALITLGLTGCAKNSNSKIITITKSDKTKEFEEKYVIGNGDKESFSEGQIEKEIEKLSHRTEQILPECEVTNKLSLEEFQGSKVYTLTKEGYDCIILYIHGGAWIYEILGGHVKLCDELATGLNAKVYMPLYPLAPQAKCDETYNMIETLYKKILKEGKKIYVMGDSAGGNLSLSLMYQIKKEELTKPEKMVLFSPCTDLSFTNSDIKEIEKIDPTLASYGAQVCTKLWSGEENLKTPKASAVYADVKGYPPTMIVQGTDEITYPDNLILFEKMKKAGVEVTLVKGEGLWHVFPIYPIAEREEALKLIEEFCLNKKTAKADQTAQDFKVRF